MKNHSYLLPILFAIISFTTFSCSKSASQLTDLSALQDVLTLAHPGDTITIKNGTYNDVSFSLKLSGATDKPIVIKAESEGEVIITGSSVLKISGDYLVVDGLCFKDILTEKSPIVIFKEGGKVAQNCRLTNCAIINCNPTNRFQKSDWVNLYGKYNRIDHCTFDGKYNAGLMLAVKLNGPENLDNHHIIEYNHFRNRPRLGSNGGETVRIGTSTYSLEDSHTRFANNYFEHCSGEVEILSVKSTNNEIFGNLFYECEGVLALRHGNNNKVTYNTFIGNNVPNTGGIRVINAGHTISNNHFQDLKGFRFWSAFAMMNGVPNSAINRYHQVKDVVFNDNVFVNCDHVGFGVGSDEERTAIPSNVTVKNNTFYGTTSREIEFFDDVSGITFHNNIISNQVKVDQSGFSKHKLTFTKDQFGCYYPTGGEKRQLLSFDDCGVNWTLATVASQTESKMILASDVESLVDAFSQVENGDTICLDQSRTYFIESPLLINKDIVICSADQLTNNPLIKYKENIGDPLVILGDGVNTEVIGIDFEGLCDGGIAPCAIATQSTPFLKSYSFKAKSCHFLNFNAGGRTVFLATPTSYADYLVFDSCKFSNISGIAICLKAEKDDIGRYSAENVQLVNCLFYDVMGSAIDLYRGGNDESTSGPKLEIDHCTFYNVENRELGSSINLTGVQEFSITNCMFSESGKSGRVIRMETPRWANATVDYCNFYHTGRLESFYTGIVGQHISKQKPCFTSLDNKDFSLCKSTSLQYKTNDGLTLGYTK